MIATDGDTNFSDFVFSATEIASFDFNGQKKRIWTATNNRPDSPQTWQFRYDPLFIPEISSDNQLLVKSEQWNESSWRTSLTILLDDNEARKLAYQTVRNVYSDKKFEIQRSSIFALQVRYLEIKIPDIQEVAPVSRIIKAKFDFSAPSKEFTIKIQSPDRDTALKIENNLPAMTLEYNFSVSARRSQQNYVSFSINKLKNSKLFTKLKGLGNVGYVHRDDLRKLLEGIHTQVNFNALIEKPEQFENGLFDKLLDHWSKFESSKNFDVNKWQSTYNQDDLKPNIITKELNKLLTKEENENQWKINPSVEINTDAGALEQIKGKVGGKVSLSNENLKKLLQEHSIEADIEGTKIEAKSIDLHQVNLADFNDDTELINIVTFVEPSEASYSRGLVEFSRLFSSKVSDEKYKVVALLGKISVGKSAIVNSLRGIDIAETIDLGNSLTIHEKLSWMLVDIPGIMGTEVNKKLAIAESQKADGLIFVIDGEPYEDEMKFFYSVNEKLPSTPKVVFVNKWDVIQATITRIDQNSIRTRIAEKMREFVNSLEDIIYGSAMIYDPERDVMVMQDIPQLINRMKEIF